MQGLFISYLFSKLHEYITFTINTKIKLPFVINISQAKAYTQNAIKPTQNFSNFLQLQYL